MISGWKAIAAYLNREERTAMRWASERGLPVHHAPGRGRGTVYALREEIDAWLAADRVRAAEARAVQPLRNASAPPSEGPTSKAWRQRRNRIALAIAIVGCLLVAIGAWTWLDRAAPRHGGDIAFTDPAAKASYLQATYDWNLRTRESLTRAVQEYGEAISRDPRVAASYTGLANSYLLLREDGSLADADAYERAAAAAQAAIDLDPDSASAHRALAFIGFWWRHDRPQARREFARAIALGPDDPLTHLWFATALSANGEQTAALREIDRARDLDPAASSIIADQGLIAYLAGRRRDGDALLRRIAAREPEAVGPHRYLAVIALWERRPRDYLVEEAATARLRGDEAARAAVDRLRSLADDPGALEGALLRRAREAATRGGGWFALARAASLAGRHDLATDALARACAAHEPGAIGARGDLWLSRTVSREEVSGLCGEESLE